MSSYIESADAMALFSGAGASAKWVRNAAGVYTQVGAGEFARTDYGLQVEGTSANGIRNDSMQVAVAGTPGSPPANWAVTSSGNGLTREIVGVGTENGLDYFDVRYYGTTTASTDIAIRSEAINQIAAAVGQTWTSSYFLKKVAGDASVFSLAYVYLGASNGTSQTEAFASSNINFTTTLTRYWITGTLAVGTTTHVYNNTIFRIPTATVVDVTLRVAAPQIEQKAYPTSPIRTTTAAVTRLADNPVRAITGFPTDRILLIAKGRTAKGQSGSSHQFIAQWDDGTSNNRHSLYRTYATGKLLYEVVAGGAGQASVNITASAFGHDTEFCIAAFAEQDNFLTSCNGVSGASDTSGLLPTGVVQERLGHYSAGSFNFDGFLRAVLVAQVPSALTMDQATLNAITSGKAALGSKFRYPLAA